MAAIGHALEMDSDKAARPPAAMRQFAAPCGLI